MELPRALSNYFSLSEWAKTRQDNDSTESKSLESRSTTTKKCLSLLESKHLSERDGTLQYSAGPEWYGCYGTFGTLASTWAPAVGQPVRVRWVPRSTQEEKNSGKKDRILTVVVCNIRRQVKNPVIMRKNMCRSLVTL